MNLPASALGILLLAYACQVFLLSPPYQSDLTNTAGLALLSISATPTSQVLTKTHVLITGATNGIGKELTLALLNLGATVIGVGRSQTKLDDLVTTTASLQGTVHPLRADLSDLDQVAKLKPLVLEITPKLDYLVNNAGIHYGPPWLAMHLDTNSPSRGMDTLFVTNYLSHFFLTELMIPLLEQSTIPNPRIVQVTSSYHWISDGLFLTPNGPLPPFAARGSTAPKPYRQAHLSYGDSKLAQLLHMHALNRRIASSHPRSNLAVIAFCPAWVGTDFAPAGIMRTIVQSIGHSPAAGIHGLLHALLHPAIVAGDFIGNTNIVNAVPFKDHLLARGFNVAGWYYPRDDLVDGMAVVMLALQRFSYGAFRQQGSPESRDEELQDALYGWSKRVVGEWEVADLQD